MSKKGFLFLFYFTIAIFSVITFLSFRWYSYRTPKVETVLRDYPIESTDPLLLKIKEPLMKDKYYYAREKKVTTISAGTFPFLDKKTTTETTVWCRSIWNKYAND